MISYVKCFWVLAESGVVRFHKVPSNLIFRRSFVGFTSTGGFGRGRCCRSSDIFTRDSHWSIAIRRVQALRWDERFRLAIRVLSPIVAVDGLAIGSHFGCRNEVDQKVIEVVVKMKRLCGEVTQAKKTPKSKCTAKPSGIIS